MCIEILPWLLTGLDGDCLLQIERPDPHSGIAKTLEYLQRYQRAGAQSMS